METTAVTAIATGFPDVAEASAAVKYVINNHFQSTVNFYVVPQQAYETLEARIAVFEDSVENAVIRKSLARTQAFRCKQDFGDCKRAAKDKVEQWMCGTTYIVCLGAMFRGTMK